MMEASGGVNNVLFLDLHDDHTSVHFVKFNYIFCALVCFFHYTSKLIKEVKNKRRTRNVESLNNLNILSKFISTKCGQAVSSDGATVSMSKVDGKLEGWKGAVSWDTKKVN